MKHQHHTPEPIHKMTTRKEVQAHGFIWQDELLTNVYKANINEVKKLSYTSEFDLPEHLNNLEPVNLSIKTTCSANTICMADCLRLYDIVSSGKPYHMTVIHYKQDDATTTKNIVNITEVDLTNSTADLFGSLTREDIESLNKLVKAVPQRRKPTLEEHTAMYILRNTLQEKSAAIQLNIKCNSQQSRLQCSFNAFQQFLHKNVSRIIAQSQTVEFRGASITPSISSGRRSFKCS